MSNIKSNFLFHTYRNYRKYGGQNTRQEDKEKAEAWRKMTNMIKKTKNRRNGTKQESVRLGSTSRDYMRRIAYKLGSKDSFMQDESHTSSMTSYD